MKKVTWQDTKDSWKWSNLKADKSLHYMLKCIAVCTVIVYSPLVCFYFYMVMK